MNAGEPLESGGLSVFNWWHKGRTKEANTIKLKGRVVARNSAEANDKVDKALRKEMPTVRWMQGREVEGNGMTFGPTTQLNRGATKQRDNGKAWN